MEKKYQTFRSLYPYYLTEHQNNMSRSLHFIVTAFVYPIYSLGSGFVMFWYIITGQIGKKLREARKTVRKSQIPDIQCNS